MLLSSSAGASPSASARDNVVILNKEMFNLIKTKLRLHSSHAIFDIFRLSITSVVCPKCFAVAWAKQFNRVIFSIEHVRNMFKHEKNAETWKDMTPWLHFIWLWSLELQLHSYAFCFCFAYFRWCFFLWIFKIMVVDHKPLSITHVLELLYCRSFILTDALLACVFFP